MILYKYVPLLRLTLVLNLALAKRRSSDSHSYSKLTSFSGGDHRSSKIGNEMQRYPLSGGHVYPSSEMSIGSHNNNANKHITDLNTNYLHSSPLDGAVNSKPVHYDTLHKHVYPNKDFESKSDMLLPGLALVNQGTHIAHPSYHGSSYRLQADDVCKFTIKRENGDYEETRIDCQILSRLILQDTEAQKTGNRSTTLTNITDMAEQTSTVAPFLGNVINALPFNDTFVPVNVTGVNIPDIASVVLNVTHNQTVPASPNPGSSPVVLKTATTNPTELVSASNAEREPVGVPPGIRCFGIKIISNKRKIVPCGFLQPYAEKVLKRNSALNHTPIFSFIAAISLYNLFISNTQI